MKEIEVNFIVLSALLGDFHLHKNNYEAVWVERYSVQGEIDPLFSNMHDSILAMWPNLTRAQPRQVSLTLLNKSGLEGRLDCSVG